MVCRDTNDGFVASQATAGKQTQAPQELCALPRQGGPLAKGIADRLRGRGDGRRLGYRAVLLCFVDVPPNKILCEQMTADARYTLAEHGEKAAAAVALRSHQNSVESGYSNPASESLRL